MVEEEIVSQGEEFSQGSAEAIRWQALFNADKDKREEGDQANGEDPEGEGDPANGEDPECNAFRSNNDTYVMSFDVIKLNEHFVKLLIVTKLAEINNGKSDSPLTIFMSYNSLNTLQHMHVQV